MPSASGGGGGGGQQKSPPSLLKKSQSFRQRIFLPVLRLPGIFGDQIALSLFEASPEKDMLERCAELVERVTEQVFAESEASVEVFLAADCGHSVDHERFVSSEARGE